MKNKEKFIEYVEDKLGQEYYVNYSVNAIGNHLKVGDEYFSVRMNIDRYNNKNDLVIKTNDNIYYYFSIINSIVNKLDRYYKKFKD